MASHGFDRENRRAFNSNADLKNPAKIEATNKNLADMEASVASLKTEHAARKASGDKSLPMIDRYVIPPQKSTI
jgi:hypothetical protein